MTLLTVAAALPQEILEAILLEAVMEGAQKHRAFCCSGFAKLKSEDRTKLVWPSKSVVVSFCILPLFPVCNI